MTEKYLLFDLEDKRSKDVATLLSNESARKILAFLSEKPASESDIAKELNIPLSTVHYNVQNLLKNELIVIKDSFYSQKGNKVHVYEAARRAIVLAPKGSSFWSLAKAYIGFVALAGIASIVIDRFVSPTREVVQEGARLAADSSAESLKFAADTAAAPPALFVSEQNVALWFFVGAVCIATLSFAYNYWRFKK